MAVTLKRAYEKPSRSDGARVLVDRLWPRGLKKEAAALESWLRDLAPSNQLRRWYHQQPERWQEFRKKYLEELRSPEALRDLEELYRLRAERSQLTLVYSSRNSERNNAVVLKELLDGMRKPPSSAGAARAAATRRRAVRRK